jgi:ankyrin repeat protein
METSSLSREDLSTCLYVACLGSSEPPKVAEVLLQHGADPDYIVYGLGGYSSFQHVCRNGDLSKVRLLYQYGAHLDLQSERGESPVYLARKGECTEVLEFLVQSGAETDLEPRFTRDIQE